MSVDRLTTSREWEEAKEDLRNEFGYSHIWRRLNAIEDILGDDYDLARLRELVELAKNIPRVCRFCVGCETEPQDGHGCDEYDSFVPSIRRLRELAEADRAGRCVVLPCKIGDSVYFITGIHGKIVKDAKVEEVYIGESGFALGVSTEFTTFTLQQSEVFFTKKAAEESLKGKQE